MLAEDLNAIDNPEDLASDLGCIASAGQELLHLNSQVGDLLEVQQGKWKSMPGQLVVDYLVQDVIDMMSERFPSHNFELDGAAHIPHGDNRTMTRLLVWLFAQLCKATATPSTIRANVHQTEDGAAIDVQCHVEEEQESEYRKLQRTFASMLVEVPVLQSIQDFDGYYRCVMCELAGATLEADPDQLSCRIRLPGVAENAEETNREAFIG